MLSVNQLDWLFCLALAQISCRPTFDSLFINYRVIYNLYMFNELSYPWYQRNSKKIKMLKWWERWLSIVCTALNLWSRGPKLDLTLWSRGRSCRLAFDSLFINYRVIYELYMFNELSYPRYQRNFKKIKMLEWWERWFNTVCTALTLWFRAPGLISLVGFFMPILSHLPFALSKLMYFLCTYKKMVE